MRARDGDRVDRRELPAAPRPPHRDAIARSHESELASSSNKTVQFSAQLGLARARAARERENPVDVGRGSRDAVVEEEADVLAVPLLVEDHV